MGLLADYITHHSEITEIKFFDENGLAKFLKVESYDKEKIKIGDKLILKVDERLDVKNYKDYIISFDDIQFGTTDKEKIKEKMYSVYESLKKIEFADTYTKKIIIKNERDKDSEGNYIIDKSKNEISFEKDDKTGNYILTKEYTRKKENLDAAIFSVHLNEEKHPHIHVWIPCKVNMGYKYRAIRNEIREVVEEKGLTLQEDTIVFDKKIFKDKENSKLLNEYRTARQLLSAYSYVLEEYKSLNDEKKQAFKEKFFKKDIINCRRYKISVKNDEHIEITNKRDKKQKVYSLDKLLEVYTNTKVGSQDFINQLISRHNALTSYSKKDITKYTSEIEKRAIEIYKNQGIDGIIQLLKDCIFDKEKVPCIIKDLWRELASSDSTLKRAVAEQMTEIYQSRATKYSEVNNERLDKAIEKIDEIYSKYENLEVHEKVLDRFEELLKTETVKESNIINTLKDEFKLDTLYIDKADKTVLRFGTKDYEKVSIKELLGDKNTVYQVIAENKNKKQIQGFASEMKTAITEATNSVGGLVAKEAIIEIMKEKPFFYLVPLHQATATDQSHEEKLDINSKKLCSIKEQSVKSIRQELQFEYVDKASILEPKRFSSIIINSIVSAFKGVFGFVVNIGKDFAEKIMQKSEIYQERLRIGNEIIGGKETDINKVKEEIEKVDRDYRERDERSSGGYER